MGQNFHTTGLLAAGLLAATPLIAAITPFSDDFESYAPGNANAYADAGYLVLGSVHEPGAGGFLYNNGPQPAPNNASAFSSVAANEGGLEQGTRQLRVHSNYSNGDHAEGRLVMSRVVQEQEISAANAGQEWVFRFDAKLGDLAGATTARGFIETVNPSAAGAVTNFVVQDTTATPVSWTTYELSLTIVASLAGQRLRFGFGNTATNFERSGVFYDNIAFFSPDEDLDGVTIDVDNCTVSANPGQEDADNDGHGNLCDADFNNDCIVDVADLNIFKTGFFGSDPLLDLDGDGEIGVGDLELFKQMFFGAPGPSATECS